MPIVDPPVEEYLHRVTPSREGVVMEMERLAEERRFPIVGPLVGALAWQIGADAWEALIVFPSTIFAAVRAEPYPLLVQSPWPIVTWMQDFSDLDKGRHAGIMLRRWTLGNLPQITFVAAVTWFPPASST